MRKNTQFTKQELADLLQQFYKYFKTGYRFEEFLKLYLERIGLEEVYVTRRSNDGGIDLTAVRKGIGGFTQSVDDTYYVQAKRYDPARTIQPEKIRALRGSFPVGKGIFITTAKVSKQAKEDALTLDAQKPVMVIDGKDLVMSCIDLELGFVYKPMFSSVSLDSLMTAESQEERDDQLAIEKQITESNIRTYILPIPKEIKERIPEAAKTLSVSFNGESFAEYNIDASRRYIGGITGIYRKYGLLQKDGAVISKKARWSINNNLTVTIDIES